MTNIGLLLVLNSGFLSIRDARNLSYTNQYLFRLQEYKLEIPINVRIISAVTSFLMARQVNTEDFPKSRIVYKKRVFISSSSGKLCLALT